LTGTSNIGGIKKKRNGKGKGGKGAEREELANDLVFKMTRPLNPEEIAKRSKDCLGKEGSETATGPKEEGFLWIGRWGRTQHTDIE